MSNFASCVACVRFLSQNSLLALLIDLLLLAGRSCKHLIFEGFDYNALVNLASNFLT